MNIHGKKTIVGAWLVGLSGLGWIVFACLERLTVYALIGSTTLGLGLAIWGIYSRFVRVAYYPTMAGQPDLSKPPRISGNPTMRSS
jgi:hypothetical protein